MHPVLANNVYLIKEHVGFLKAANNYDVVNPETGEELLHCREPNLGFFTKIARFTDYKRMTPFHIEVTTPSGDPVLRVQRGISVILSKVTVYDDEGEKVGGFKQKFFSIGGAFNVLGPNEQVLCALKGKWTAWDFSFEKDGKQYARVTKKWQGLGRELFTSADNYILEISPEVPSDNPLRELILGAVFCIDMVLKE